MESLVWDEWQTWAAIYAALVATAALALEIRRWFETGVRLTIHLMPNAGFIEDGRFGDERSIVVTVSNRGDRAATITHLAIYDYSGPWYSYWWRRLRHRPTKTLLIPDARATPLHPPAFPSVLEPGKQWQGFADWNALKPLVIESKGRMLVAVVSSDANRPKLKRIPLRAATAPEPRTLEQEARGDFLD